MEIVMNGVKMDTEALKNASATGTKEEPQTITKQFPGNSLIVEDVPADVKIIPAASDSIVEVTVTGPKSLIDKISASEEGGTVTVKGDGSSHSRAINIVSRTSRKGGIQINSINSGTICISNGSIIINDSGAPEVSVEIKVPDGTDLDISGVNGDVSIGYINSNLRVHAMSSGSIRARSVKNLHARISGSGDLFVDRADGDVSAHISGSGDIEVHGTIRNLEAEVTGSGDIQIYATAQTADLTVSGSGDIYAARVVKPPRWRINGSGDIEINRIG